MKSTTSQINRLPERKPASLRSVLAVPLVCICLLFLMDAAGARARKFIPVRDDKTIDIVVLRSTGELYRYWKGLGIKGRIVVHAGRYLHYVASEDDSRGYRATRVYPVTLRSLQREMESGVNHTNLLRVAVQSNMARQLYMLMPPEAFESRFSSDADYPERGKGIVHAGDIDAFRTIVTALPEITERVVLSIDASYLAGSNGNYLLEWLLGDNVKADVITFCLSEDNPDVLEDDRRRAIQLLERFAAASDGRVKVVRNSEGMP